MIRKIAFIGATGSLGQPVARALHRDGFALTALVRNETAAKKVLPEGIKFVNGDMKNVDDLKTILRDQDALFLNLSIKQTEKPGEWHSEAEGMRQLLPLAKDAGIKRIFYIASLVMRYQGMNGCDWWVFRIKYDAIGMLKSSGIPSTIFYPSTFMEAIPAQYKAGKRLLLAGESKFKQYFIAAEDYARQAAAAVRQTGSENRDYVIQGPDGYTTDEAVEVFRQNYAKEKLSISRAPAGMIRFLGLFFQKLNYGSYILEALNNYPEKFEASKTWEDLGKPTITLPNFTKSL